MSVITVTKDNFDEVVIKNSKTVVIDFWAPWCMPCRMLSPLVDEIAEERDDIVVGKINIDEEMDLANEYDIMSIPAVLVFRNGEEVNRSIGAVPKEDLLALLD